MASSTQKNIIDSLDKKIADRNDQITFLKENITVLDDQKGDLDAAIKNLDTYLLPDIVDVNTKLNAVKTAYEARFTAGCRSRLFWRRTSTQSVVGVGTTLTYTQTNWTCTKITPNGYAPNSASSTNILYFDESLVQQSASLSSLVRMQSKNLYGIKYYDEPYTADVIDSFVAGFIGTVGAGSTILTVMSPVENGAISAAKVGQLVVCDKTGLYSATNTIIGIGTTIANLSGVGIASTTATVNRIITEVASVLSAKAPEDDGSFVSFTILKAPSEIGNVGIPFGSNPYSPQSIGMLTSSNVGIGVSVKYDNSGYPSQTQSWNINLVGSTLSNGTVVTEPNVGAGKVYYELGFTSKPIIRNTSTGAKVRDAVEGDTAFSTTDPFYSFPSYNVEALPTCATQETALTSAISTANAAESAIASGTTNLNYRLAAATALRDERNDINIQIWGLRQLIGKMESEQATYVGVQSYISSSLVKDII